MHWIARIDGGPKRVNHAAIAVGHKIYSFGGYCMDTNYRVHESIDVHVLNTTTFRWTKHPVSELPYFENDDILPYKRYGHTAVLYQDRIYIWGGRNDIAACPELFCFDTQWHCWRTAKTTGDLPVARDGHSACVWKNQMIIFGGFEDDSGVFAGSVHTLNLDTRDWCCLQTRGEEPTVRDFHTTVCIGDKMYMFGGRGSNPRNGVYFAGQEIYCPKLWYLDLKTFVWHQPRIIGERPVGRRSHSAFVYQGRMYVFGGFNAITSKHYNDMWEFDPMSNTWRCIVPLGESPVQRRRHACVLVGHRAFLFGGTSPPKDCSERDNDKLVDYNDLHVLDFQPTLKTLCLAAVLKHNLKDSILPAKLRTELINMHAPNTITPNRPINSAG